MMSVHRPVLERMATKPLRLKVSHWSYDRSELVSS
jgi:hypothetical protein